MMSDDNIQANALKWHLDSYLFMCRIDYCVFQQNSQVLYQSSIIDAY